MHSDSLETIHLHVHANPEGMWTLQSNALAGFCVFLLLCVPGKEEEGGYLGAVLDLHENFVVIC